MDPMIERLQSLIDSAKSICVFTGAGISTESGIPDFRSQNGLYRQNLTFVDVVSRSFFERRPKEFWPLFKEIFHIKMLHEYKPNRGHQFIAALQSGGKDIRVITQNIDGLHQDAGNVHVYEIHGSIKKGHCPKCKTIYDLAYLNEKDIPRCSHILENGRLCALILKPNVVLFGDSIYQFEEAVEAALNCDLFIVLGSSLEVTPVNQIPVIVYQNRKVPMVMINRDETRYDSLFDLRIYDSIGEVVSKIQTKSVR
ncbi:NAD-dependent protein deacylase [Metabacillus iocasae]|uniref:protein acetyllysine N-acetyltransferase n=1 Tax=Priestia iocasae TaxID=2291674 RepID=A0ABS2QUF3_9BACI|nr:NAD-dependent protein deacylase [Metabacillus iocasae]MBM7703116.1 NAD-dependent SIR2 family protein deacetylase [Metabacillus iocasae]